MTLNAKHRNLLFLAASVAVLAACGAEEIASPGSGGNIVVNNPAGLFTTMLPPLPGEAISSAPQAASTATDAARNSRLRCLALRVIGGTP